MAAASTQKNVEKELDALKSDLASIKGDVQSLVEALMGQAQEEGEELATSAKKNIMDSVGSLETRIEEHPLTSVLVALGVGLFVGKLFSK